MLSNLNKKDYEILNDIIKNGSSATLEAFFKKYDKVTCIPSKDAGHVVVFTNKTVYNMDISPFMQELNWIPSRFIDAFWDVDDYYNLFETLDIFGAASVPLNFRHKLNIPKKILVTAIKGVGHYIINLTPIKTANLNFIQCYSYWNGRQIKCLKIDHASAEYMGYEPYEYIKSGYNKAISGCNKESFFNTVLLNNTAIDTISLIRRSGEVVSGIYTSHRVDTHLYKLQFSPPKK